MAEKKPRKRVVDLKVHEISFVDNPAVPGARFLIVKRHEEGGGSMKLEDEKAEVVDVTPDPADVIKAGEEVTKQGLEAVKEARAMITKLMLKRSDLPNFFRRMVMEMDIALDEFMRSHAEFLRRAEGTDEEDATKREDEEKSEEKTRDRPEEEEEEEEKARDRDEKQVKPTDGKCPEGMRLDEEKGICIPIPPKAKTKARDCPPGMEFDEEKGKCVPKNKKKDEKAEKKEDEESAPRGDGDKLELSPKQQIRVDKLLAKYKKEAK